jgi:hypothetical protein
MTAYATIPNLKDEIGITDGIDDPMLDRALDAASRWIDNKTGTRFFTTAADETRYYTLTGGDIGVFLCPDDILSVTSLYGDPNGDRLYSDTWAVTDFDLSPLGATPYTWIETAPSGNYRFTSYRRGIKIVGRFGYSTLANCPADVIKATLMMAARLFKRKDAVFGVMGMASMGQVQLQIPNDPDVADLLRWYIVRNRGPY